MKFQFKHKKITFFARNLMEKCKNMLIFEQVSCFRATQVATNILTLEIRKSTIEIEAETQFYLCLHFQKTGD